MTNLKIAFVTPETVPFAKTGGLADVSGALPGALAKLGHNVKLFMPRYRQLITTASEAVKLDKRIECTIGEWSFQANLYYQQDKTTGVEYYFIDNEFLYDRQALYIDSKTGEDYPDNDDRFIFLCRAVIESLKTLNWKADIIHANDWQSALIPTYLKTLYKDDEFFKDTKTVFSIHNMGYQGQFPMEISKKLGIDKSLFEATGPLEYWGDINFMKSGIWFADHLTTVSPTYAEEIQSSDEFGKGLQGVLKERTNKLTGVLNGVDYDIWSPNRDTLIPYKYNINNLSGKKKDKLELLHKCQLPIRMEQPLIGVISRLDKQKGFDLLEEIIDEIMELPLQMVLLGTGDDVYHQLFDEIEQKYPDRFKGYLTFDNNLAHLIEAGSDIFLMPSRYEPCGLNQMYSLKYGTVPIVRKTGGLADTVVDFDESNKTGTGFVFENYESQELLITVERAVNLFSKKRLWYKIMKSGMREDYSWDKSAREYSQLFQSLTNESNLLKEKSLT